MRPLRKVLFPLLSALFLLPSFVSLQAQNGYKKIDGKFMPFFIEGNDTVYYAPLKPAVVYDRKKRLKGRQWRKYYRLVYNFAIVYPYAMLGKGIVSQADSTIKADNLRAFKKERYVNALIIDLFKKYEKNMRNMTISQGELLMRLIDRECGIEPYYIIRDFKSQFSAGFWQAIARLFGNDLKRSYDPDGKDAPTEELVQQWQDGTFEQTYFEIFWKYPPEPFQTSKK